MPTASRFFPRALLQQNPMGIAHDMGHQKWSAILDALLWTHDIPFSDSELTARLFLEYDFRSKLPADKVASRVQS